MAYLSETIRNKDTLRSAARFLAVGMLGTLIDFSLFAALNLLLGLPALLSNSLAYSAGIINNYLLHRSWTFAQRPRRAAGRQFAQFLGVSLAALALNNLLVLLLAEPFGQLLADASLGAAAAKIAAILLGLGWNFLANHRWTFQSGPAT
jgi:putative flippase GtrA